MQHWREPVFHQRFGGYNYLPDFAGAGALTPRRLWTVNCGDGWPAFNRRAFGKVDKRAVCACNYTSIFNRQALEDLWQNLVCLMPVQKISATVNRVDFRVPVARE